MWNCVQTADYSDLLILCSPCRIDIACMCVMIQIMRIQILEVTQCRWVRSWQCSEGPDCLPHESESSKRMSVLGRKPLNQRRIITSKDPWILSDVGVRTPKLRMKNGFEGRCWWCDSNSLELGKARYCTRSSYRVYMFLINIFSVYSTIMLWDQYYLSKPIGLFFIYSLACELHTHTRNVTNDTS